MSAALTLHLTGPFRAMNAAGAPCDGLSRRAQAMLAFLACQPDMRAERATLADLLWSDRPEAQARASLRQELSVLRRQLEEGLLSGDRRVVWLDRARILTHRRAEEEFLQGFDLASEGFEDWLRQERSRHDTRQDQPPTAGRASLADGDTALSRSGERPTLAVLPFEDRNSGADDMLADAIVDEITGALSRVADFHVIARQSAFALRARALDIRGAAAALGADYIVEGTVRRAQDRVRISVDLVDSDGRTLWSNRYDDLLDELFELQDRIAAQVAGQLSPHLRQVEIDRARAAPPRDRTAYTLTLTALPHFWAHRKDENATAIRLLDDALALAPDYGTALAYKAWALAQQPAYMWSDDPLKDRLKALEIANAAMRHVGDHAASLVAIGAAVSLTSLDIPLARSFIDRALRLDRNNAWGWMRLGYCHVYAGDPEAALSCFEHAERLSPLDPFRFNFIFGRSIALRNMGKLRESVDTVRDGMRANPGMTWAYRMLVGDLMMDGREEEAKEALNAFLHHYPHVTLSYLRNAWPPSIFETQPEYINMFARAGVPER